MSNSLSDSGTRNRSDSTEDSELPEHERKRPRLSESTSDTNVLPDRETQTATSSLLPSSTIHKVNNHEEGALNRSPPRPSRLVDAKMSTSPTSQVTINTRPLSSQSMSTPVIAPNDFGATEGPAAHPSAAHANNASSSDMRLHATIAQPQSASDRPETISISSGSGSSPEIEVAEVEDYDQNPDETRWTQRLGGASSTGPRPIGPNHVYNTFPHVNRYKLGEGFVVLKWIGDAFRNGDPHDGEFFQQAKNWLMDFASRCHFIGPAMIHEDLNFWLKLPLLIEGLLERRMRAPKQALQDELVDFFVAFGQITKLIMDYDIRALRSANDDPNPNALKELELVSFNYILPLAWALSLKATFYGALRQLHLCEPAPIISAVTDSLVDPSTTDLIHTIERMFTTIGGIIPRKGNLCKMLPKLVILLSNLMQAFLQEWTDDLATRDVAFAQQDNIRQSAMQALQVADDLIQDAITKQAPWLTIDTGNDIISNMNTPMRGIAVEVPLIGKKIITSIGMSFDDTELTSFPSIMNYAWKFKTLRRFVTAGRMELRVYGIETMSTELVHVYHSHINGKLDGDQDPLVKFLVRFIQETKLIHYIIGVDSHPQLVQRSANIVGFLCVAKTYSNSETDRIWNTVLESQDPRTVVEVLHVLQCTFLTFDPAALHYICQKVLELPFARFDARMLQFADSLLNQLQTQTVNSPQLRYQPFHPVTRQLCMHLLRESNSPANIISEQAAQIRTTISSQLLKLFKGPRPDRSFLAVDEEEESAMLRQLEQDIRDHGDAACGSMHIMWSILESLDARGILRLLSRFDCITLLLIDLQFLRDGASALDSTSPSRVAVEYDSRLGCLSRLISTVPEEFEVNRVESLWTLVLATELVPETARLRAWTVLTEVMRQSRGRNPALDLILKDFLPRLRSGDFNGAVLVFSQEAVRYETQGSKLPLMDAGGEVSIPGIDRVWRIMLETPPGTVEADATDFIIAQYLSSDIIRKRPRPFVDATHAALIERCVKLVIESATRLKSFANSSSMEDDDQMVIIASQDEIRAEELRFDRSLLFLRRFLESHQSSQHSPSSLRQQASLPAFNGRKGQDFELIIQVPYSKFITNIQQKIAFGSENTGDELWQYLASSTGFDHFQTLTRGQRMNLQGESATLKELKLDTGQILVHKLSNTTEHVPTNVLRASSPVDDKVMHHFDELYALLDAQEHLAQQVYSFLSVSSVHNGMMEVVRSMSKKPTELLPPEKPYKLLYCVQALRLCIEEESYSTTPDAALLQYSVHTIVSILPLLDLAKARGTLGNSIAYDLSDVLTLALKAKVPSEVSQAYFHKQDEFSDQMLAVLELALRPETGLADQKPAQDLVRVPFDALIEASLHDECIWGRLEAGTDFRTLLQRALLDDPRIEVRRAVLGVILGLTGSSGAKISLQVNDPRAPKSRFPPVAIENCLTHLWQALLTIVAEACWTPEHCREALDATLAIMRRLGRSLSADVVNQQFRQWSELLLNHEHREIVGQPSGDHVIAGLTKLLLECCRLLRSAPLFRPTPGLVQELSLKFLFPPLSESGMSRDPHAMPVLDSTVRDSLYELVLSLSQQPTELDAVVSDLCEDHIAEDCFEPNYTNDRQSLRSEVGYAGLKNLSNTCYLNSLFSQLFMNVQFRELLFGINVIDDSKQKLIVELRKVYANMQSSYEKSVDPSGAVEAITTYDGEQIDVTVQMDVDEFFNLLFDRLEGQIVDPKSRNFFKSMYGGQIVQQIKSKECEHISERLEPFSAIPVEIKGKARLEDSLKAYVEGEILQGENKYSCSGCEKHVDAVKRACLKDVPDNLIFNLKRFDYDIMTGLRCKVNDEFHFPETIDVAPYTLDYLMNPNKLNNSDLFELTGIIVHSGTADSGHYYSFIRQRPSGRAKDQSWVQFNDQDVAPFDPAQIQDGCFGGPDPSLFNMPKFYNGYMLFYQRASSIGKLKKQYTEYSALEPVRLSLPVELGQFISQSNEMYLRSYCIQDPSHARFVRQLLERVRPNNQRKCSENHGLESRMLDMVLRYVQQVSSRWKNNPEFEDTIRILEDQAQKCPHCADTMVLSLVKQKIVPSSIVKSPYPIVRKSFASLLCTCFAAMRDHTEQLEEGPEKRRMARRYDNFVAAGLQSFSQSWEAVTRAGRSWPEYFGALSSIMELGESEVMRVIDNDFIEKCLELLLVCSTTPFSKELRAKYQPYVAAREKNRPFNHGVFQQVLVALLLKVDLHLPPTEDERSQNSSGTKLGLSNVERRLLGFGSLPPSFVWLRSLIAQRHAPMEANTIVSHLAADHALAGPVSRIISKGLEHNNMAIAAAYLHPTVLFAQVCQSENQIMDLLGSALESILTISAEYTKDYLTFIQLLTKAENDAIGGEQGFLIETLLQHIDRWPSILLLSPNSVRMDVRGEAAILLQLIVLEPLEHARAQRDAQALRLYQSHALNLAWGCAEYANKQILRNAKESALQPGQAREMLEVVDSCVAQLDVGDTDVLQRISGITRVMEELKRVADQAVETLSTADWQESSEIEPLDSDLDEIGVSVSPDT